MSIEAARREALDQLRTQLSDGALPEVAVAAAADASGLKASVIAIIGEPLIAQREELVRSRERELARHNRQARAHEILRRYREELREDPNAPIDKFDEDVGVGDFSDNERDDLFNQKLDSWLNRNS